MLSNWTCPTDSPLVSPWQGLRTAQEKSDAQSMKISRRDLFNCVWSTPMTKLAEEFDISDVGLSKICRKCRIPTPPPGHWAKVAHSKAVKRPALPAGNDDMLTFDAQQHRQTVHPEDVRAEEFADVKVQVANAVEILAPTAAATFALLSKAKP